MKNKCNLHFPTQFIKYCGFLALLAILLSSCTSNSQKLSRNIITTKGNLISKDQREIFKKLLANVAKERSKKSKRKFVYALKNVIDIQTHVKMGQAEYDSNETHIQRYLKNEQLINAARFINAIGINNYNKAETFYKNLDEKTILKLKLSHLQSRYLAEKGESEKSYQTLRLFTKQKNSNAFEDILYRTHLLYKLKYHANSDADAYTTIHEICDIIPLQISDIDYVLFDILKQSAYGTAVEVLRQTFIEPLPDRFVNKLFINICGDTANSKKADNLILRLIEKKNILTKKRVPFISTVVSSYILKKSTSYVSSYVDKNTGLPDSILYNIGSILLSENMGETIRLWKIPYENGNESEYASRLHYSNALIFENNYGLAKTVLSSLIDDHQSKPEPRLLYLNILFQTFDLELINDFLISTESKLDAEAFKSSFSSHQKNVMFALKSNYQVWKNDSSTVLYAKDISGIKWFFDKYLNSIDSYLFINDKGEERIWSKSGSKEYLYDKNFVYQNIYKWENEKNKTRYAIIKKQKTFYYNENMEWLSIYSYVSDKNNLIFVKSEDEREYFYDADFNYLNFYSFKESNGTKYFAKEKESRTDLFDEDWRYLNISYFKYKEGDRLYAYVYPSSVKLMYQSGSSDAKYIGIRLIKSKSGKLMIEEGHNDLFDYYNVNGRYLNMYTWYENGKLKAISVSENGDCETIIIGFTKISDCSANERKLANIIHRSSFLNYKTIELSGELIRESSTTPYELFSDIKASIKKHQKQQNAMIIAAAITSAANSISQSLANPTTYNSYSNPYSYNTKPSSNSYSNYNYSSINTFKPSTQAYTNPYSKGGKLYARDGTFLGNMNSNPYDYNSVSNPYGKYGNQYSGKSINNQFSKYGNPYSLQSVNTQYGKGVMLFSNDGRYLGNVNKNQFDYNSINNPFGKHGNPYSGTSINNPYNRYGNPYSSDYTPNLFKLTKTNK